MSKHQEILDYLLQLEIGKRVSVRSISNYLNVSEGTAYRAIKEAEAKGIVETRPRSGTVRVKEKTNVQISKITYAEIARISDSRVIAGHEGLNHGFSKFAIGAMTEQNIGSYLVKGGLLIVGDRENIQLLALKNANAILVTGGFSVSERVKEVSNKFGIPVMVSHYDTFTVATMINQALQTLEEISSEKNVSELYQKKEDYGFLRETDTIGTFNRFIQTSSYFRFPVVDNDNNLVGIISARDILEKKNETLLKEVMSQELTVTTLQEPLVTIAQKMIYQDLTILPVVTSTSKLIGVITRRRILENLPYFKTHHYVSDKVILQDKESDYVIISPSMLDGNQYLHIHVVQEFLKLALEKESLEEYFSFKEQVMYHLMPIEAGACLRLKKIILMKNSNRIVYDYQFCRDEQIIVKIILILEKKE